MSRDNYDGQDILQDDATDLLEEEQALKDGAHDDKAFEDARDILQEQKKGPQNNGDDGCEFWREVDDGPKSTVEYCKKYKSSCSCSGSISQCSEKEREAKVEKSLVTQEAIVMPAVTPEKAVEAFEAYQSLAKKIMTPDDVQDIQGKTFKKKSFWRKCQRFFNLSVEIKEEKREAYDGYFVYKFIARATAPNGAYMDGTGTCSSNEKGLLKTEHNTRAIAETRAKNRAISDLVAFGEVSAEEVDGEPNGHKPVDEAPNSDRSPVGFKIMESKYDSTCKACGDKISKGDKIAYSKEKGVFHPDCA